MDDSPLVSPLIKEYCTQHNIEEILNNTIQSVLTTLPSDPYSLMCSLLKENCSSIYKVESLEMSIVYTSDFKEQILLEVELNYKGNRIKGIRYFVPFIISVYDDYVEKNRESVLQIFNEKFKNNLVGYTIEQFPSYDKRVSACVPEYDKDNCSGHLIGKQISNAISIASLMSMANVTSNMPLMTFVNNYYPQYKYNSETIPDLGFALFKTGKSMNSKVKFERFILFINNSSCIGKEELEGIVNRIYSAIRKFLTAGKAGENGVRLNNEGNYYPPIDTLNDILKLMEGIINESNAAGKLYYGIELNGNNFYSEETNLYEMDGFKKPPDNEQMIEFYLKLCTDHPLLLFLEDPMADKDLHGWRKLLEKFEESKPNVHISCKALISENEDKLKEIIEEKEEPLQTGSNQRSKVEEEENMTEEEIRKKEEEEAKRKAEEEEAKRKAEEEEARIKAEEAKLKKKPVKPVKPLKKTDEEMKKTQEDLLASLPPPLPLKLKNISIRQGEFASVTDIVSFFEKPKKKKIALTIYDNGYETDQTGIIDLGLSMRVDRIVLNGFYPKNEKINKIYRYVDLISELY